MTVGELIEKLEQYDDELEIVVVDNFQGSVSKAGSIRLVNYDELTQNIYYDSFEFNDIDTDSTSNEKVIAIINE